MTTIRNQHSIRAGRTNAMIRTPALRRMRGGREGRSETPRQRPTVRRLTPLTHRGVRPLLRLVASNPHLPRAENAPGRRHLRLVGATVSLPAPLQGPDDEPWVDAERSRHLLIVLGLAAAGLLALATSIGRLLSTAL